MYKKNNLNNELNDITNPMTIITDKLGNIYMGIHNFYNSFCYFISAIHRLHSSKSLTHELNKNIFDENNRNNSKETHKIAKKIMQILIDYNQLTDNINIGLNNKKLNIKNKLAKNKILNLNGGSIEENTIATIYNNMFNYKQTIDEYFHEDLKHGGDPQTILLYLFFPIIYHYTDDATFINILKELNFNPIHFSNTNYSINSFNMIKDNKENFNDNLKKWYCDILKYLDDNSKQFDENMFDNQFCVTTLCIYFASVYKRDYSPNAGHAVTVVLGNDDQFYIIDDHKNIKLFNNYIKLKKSSIFELELKDLTSDVIKKIATWNDYIVDNRIYRTVLRPKTSSLFGGKKSEDNFDEIQYTNNENSKPTISQVFKWMNVTYQTYMDIYYMCLIILITILIIVIINYIRLKNNLKIVNELIDIKTKRIKSLQKKLESQTILPNSIEAKSNKLKERFIDSNQVLDKNAIIKPRIHLNVGIADPNNYSTNSNKFNF
jgi:hypothetical protein